MVCALRSVRCMLRGEGISVVGTEYSENANDGMRIAIAEMGTVSQR
jgi:hypothetical protein